MTNSNTFPMKMHSLGDTESHGFTDTERTERTEQARSFAVALARMCTEWRGAGGRTRRTPGMWLKNNAICSIPQSSAGDFLKWGSPSSLVGDFHGKIPKMDDVFLKGTPSSRIGHTTICLPFPNGRLIFLFYPDEWLRMVAQTCRNAGKNENESWWLGGR